MTLLRRWVALFLVLGMAGMLAGCGGFKPGNARAQAPLKEATVAQLKAMGSSPAEGTLIRIFKESSELEVWKRTAGGTYKHFRTYEICAWSGELGPKIREGDRQSPEGFYTITPGLLNPNSNYYLAFNTGFPNKFDRAHGRTGSNLMVHGDCSSSGCYSMTDDSIAEIYALVRDSFAGGNDSVQLQIFPFRMTPQNLARHASSPHLAFWKDIKEGYDRFELTRTPPRWDVCNREYVFDVPRDAATVLDAAAACPPGLDRSTMTAALQTKQAADDAAMATEVAALAARQAKAAAEAEKAAAELAAAKARGEAIGSFVSGLFGGKDAGAEKVIDPSLKAPVPAPRIQRV
ncbi:L,D-transpeptidase family protein [Devosia sp.]|uniref:L,D-transpeptidase family protein n=1 Tax=Devosia sp. TaxID=1871048 RepID=UPI002F16C0C0